MKKVLLLMGLIFTVTAASTIVAEEKVPDCMSDVQPGEWVIYEMPGRLQQKHVVLDVKDGAAIIQMQTIMNGQVLSTIEETVTLSEMTDKTASLSPKIYKGDVEVKGQKMGCTVVETTVEGKLSKTYMSNDIPVMGILVAEYDGTKAMQLIDYGFESQPEE